jgi:hypothetical protein
LEISAFSTEIPTGFSEKPVQTLLLQEIKMKRRTLTFQQDRENNLGAGTLFECQTREIWS